MYFLKQDTVSASCMENRLRFLSSQSMLADPITCSLSSAPPPTIHFNLVSPACLQCRVGIT